MSELERVPGFPPHAAKEWSIMALHDDPRGDKYYGYYVPVLLPIAWVIASSHGGIEVWRKL